ncbi:MAG: hypothetical protein DMG93_15545, partial [Acidobacteria bacterium]
MIGEKLGYSTFPPAPITGADSPIAFTHARRQPVGQTLQNCRRTSGDREKYQGMTTGSPATGGDPPSFDSGRIMGNSEV